METVTNAANAASRMIFGDSTVQSSTANNETGGQEPISGEQGKGTVNEPFDQGNAEQPTTDSTSTKPSSNSMSINPDNAAQGGQPRPEHETDKTGVTGGMSADPKAADIKPSESASNPGAAPESGGAQTHKQQGADKPTKGPEGAEEGAVKEKKDDAEEALKKRDPNDHSGEPMHMHGSSDVPKTQEERRESKVGNPGGQEHGKEEKGTGEEWVKTSGLQADGGDFDATKPGAGREADRLLEQKGIHKSEPGEPAVSSDTGPSEGKEGKEKVSMGQKIKDKLHIGKDK